MTGQLKSTAHAILDAWPVGVLSTYGKEGIDSVPVVFVREEDALFVPVDGKPKSGRELARVRNLRSDPRYTLLVQQYEDDWSSLWWLRVRGRAVLHEQVDETASRYVSILAALATKYPQYADVGVDSGSGQMIELGIDSLNAWAYQGLDWLTRRFG